MIQDVTSKPESEFNEFESRVLNPPKPVSIELQLKSWNAECDLSKTNHIWAAA